MGGTGDNTLQLSVDNGFNWVTNGSSAITLTVISYNSPLYVSNAGNDSTGHGTLGDPLKTIGYAASVLRAGDEVRVFPGTYSTNAGEVFPIQPAGVRVIGYDPAATWSPTNHIIDGRGIGVNLFKYYQQGSTNGYLANLTLSNVSQSAVYLDASRLIVSNCSFQNIVSGGGNPAGAWLWNNSSMTALNSEFRNLNGKGAVGFEVGTIANDANNFWATNCLFLGNYSQYGTVYAFNLPGRFWLSQCTFQSNSVLNQIPHDTYTACVVFNEGGTGTEVIQVDRCRILDNTNGVLFGFSHIDTTVSIRNSLFVNNKCTYDLLHGYSWGGSVVNCTFVRNKGTLTGHDPSGLVYLRNSIVSSNDTPVGGGNAAYLVLQTNLIWQASLGLYLTNSSSGMITNADPLLLPSYTLGGGSPAVNAGNNAWMADPYDLAGNHRTMLGIVDLGAYEQREPGSVFVFR